MVQQNIVPWSALVRSGALLFCFGDPLTLRFLLYSIPLPSRAVIYVTKTFGVHKKITLEGLYFFEDVVYK